MAKKREFEYIEQPTERTILKLPRQVFEQEVASEKYPDIETAVIARGQDAIDAGHIAAGNSLEIVFSTTNDFPPGFGAQRRETTSEHIALLQPVA